MRTATYSTFTQMEYMKRVHVDRMKYTFYYICYSHTHKNEYSHITQPQYTGLAAESSVTTYYVL